MFFFFQLLNSETDLYNVRVGTSFPPPPNQPCLAATETCKACKRLHAKNMQEVF